MPSGNFSRFVGYLQLDRTLLYALSARAWQAVAGPIGIFLLIHCLTLDEQGVYYGLASFVGLQTFFELGLLNILVSHSAHLNAELRSTVGRQRMGQLVAMSRLWFLYASCLFAAASIGLGWWVLSEKSTELEWRWPLVALSIAAAAGVAISPDLAILEGAGFRSSIYRTRMLQMISGAFAVWLALLLGWKLWALVVSSTVQFLWSVWLARSYHRDFFVRCCESQVSRLNVATHPQRGSLVMPEQLSWVKEVLPTQWRAAVVSLFHHAATQFFTLIVLYFHGTADAGRLGITLTITAAIQGLSLSWIQTKFAVVSNCHASGQREFAGELWQRSAIVSSVLMVFAMSALVLILALLPFAKMGWENRFLQPWEVAVLAVGCLANHLTAAQGFYVLARKGLPFLAPSLIGFSLTGLAVLLGGCWYSSTGVVIGFALAAGVITLPAHTLAFWNYRRNT